MEAPTYDEKSNSVHLGDAQEVSIELGSHHRVVLDKVFGPTVFAELLITADPEKTSWMIERRFGPEDDWVKWVEIPGQLPQDFSDGSS